MKPLNIAQQILIKLGVPETVVKFGHLRDLSFSNTKKGSGRKHKYGKII